MRNNSKRFHNYFKLATRARLLAESIAEELLVKGNQKNKEKQNMKNL